MKKFNTTGLCVPRKHYMVDISGRVKKMRAMVDAGDHFCINRGRQYGKTTTLAALERSLAGDYAVAGLDFQALSHADFRTEGAFVSAFAREVLHFILEERLAGSRVYDAGDIGRSVYVRGGRLNMCAVLEGFRRAYVEVYGPPEEGRRFLEKDGRELFLLFLKPVINGTGNYYVEAQTRDRTRMDVVVDYAGERFVVELKIWRGPRYNEEGERQVAGYLEHFGLDVGYMLSFCFNRAKEPGLRRVPVGNKVLWEEVV